MESLIIDIIGITVNAVIIFFITRWVYRKIKSRNVKITIDHLGMVTLDEEVIQSIRLPKKEKISIVGFPENYRKLIRKPTAYLLAKFLIEVSEDDIDSTSEKSKELCRIATVLAVIYKVKIPYRLLRIDERTKENYIILTNELELLQVPKIKSLEELKQLSPIHGDLFEEHPFSEKEFTVYQDQLTQVGSLLIGYTLNSNFPSLDVFVAEVRKNKNKFTALSSEIIMSLATAYAAITGILIPRSYVSYDSLSIALMNSNVNSNRVKLRVVK
jgi:hypothetical protein